MKKYRCPHCLGRAITKTSGLSSLVGRIYCVGDTQCVFSGTEDDFIVEEYAEVPVELTADNGAKAALMGEFHVKVTLDCPDCGGEGCDNCSQKGQYTQRTTVPWTTIKEIYRAALEHFSQDLKETNERQGICAK